jgi:hypothetical protein
MEETMKNAVTEELNEQTTLTEEEVTTAEKETEEDPFKAAVEEQLKKIQRQNLLIGAQTMCRVILEKIVVAEAKPGKRTMNDYKRLIKDIKQFCTTGISRKVNADGETEPIEEETAVEKTVQN